MWYIVDNFSVVDQADGTNPSVSDAVVAGIFIGGTRTLAVTTGNGTTIQSSDGLLTITNVGSGSTASAEYDVAASPVMFTGADKFQVTFDIFLGDYPVQFRVAVNGNYSIYFVATFGPN